MSKTQREARKQQGESLTKGSDKISNDSKALRMNNSINDLMNNYHSLFQQWLNLSQSLMPPAPMGPGPLEGEGASDADALSRAMLQALTAAASSSLSYSYSIQSILYKYQASLLGINSGNAEIKHKRALLIDDLRSFLREIGETASREGRSFQHQLALITEQLAQAEAHQREAHPTDNPNPS